MPAPRSAIKPAHTEGHDGEFEELLDRGPDGAVNATEQGTPDTLFSSLPNLLLVGARRLIPLPQARQAVETQLTEIQAIVKQAAAK